MSGISMLLLALSASSDSFIIGLNYGVRGVRITNVTNLFLSLLCFAGTFAAMLAGRSLGHLFDPAWAQLVAGALFVILGLWMLRGAIMARPEQAVRRYSQNPEIVDKDRSNVIELRESLLIGVLLCLNNVGLGIGGGMAGVPIVLTPLVCAAASFTLIKLGCFAGDRIENRDISKVLETLSALLILILGVGELLSLPLT